MRVGSPLMIGCHDAAYHDSVDSPGNCRKTAHFRQFLVQQIKTNCKTTWVSGATYFVILRNILRRLTFLFCPSPILRGM
jgi:hypothetical protein